VYCIACVILEMYAFLGIHQLFLVISQCLAVVKMSSAILHHFLLMVGMDVPLVNTSWYFFYAEESIKFQNICGFCKIELDCQGKDLEFLWFPILSHPMTISDVLSDNSLLCLTYISKFFSLCSMMSKG
jgi:hypothetical protein